MEKYQEIFYWCAKNDTSYWNAKLVERFNIASLFYINARIVWVKVQGLLKKKTFYLTLGKC